jgi:hypothetical protein
MRRVVSRLRLRPAATLDNAVSLFVAIANRPRRHSLIHERTKHAEIITTNAAIVQKAISSPFDLTETLDLMFTAASSWRSFGRSPVSELHPGEAGRVLAIVPATRLAFPLAARESGREPTRAVWS